MALTSKLQAIANAIRSKTGGTAKLSLDAMATAISNLKTTFSTQTKTVDISSNGTTTINKDSAYDGMTKVTVNVDVPTPTPSYDTPSITVSTSGLITASANGKDNTKQLTTQAAKTVSPTESEQTAVNSGVYTTGIVKVGAISKTFVGSSVTRQSAKTVTPTKSSQTAVASGVYTTGSITVGAIPSEYIIPSGSETKTSNGTYDVTSLAELVVAVAGGGGGLPSGISAIDFGNVVVNSSFTTSRQTFTHKLGTTPDVVIVYSPTNIATTYSMLFAMRGNVFNWRGGNYSGHMAYHGNSTSTVTWTNANSTSYGVSNMTSTSFQLASSSSSYYWRAGTYKYIAIKFS